MEQRPIRKPWSKFPEHDRSAPRVNRAIRVREVFLIDEKGENVGNVPTDVAQRRADEAGLDLVEVNPAARPPVCKIINYGKYKYSLQKKKSSQKGKQSKVKEVRLHPRTSEHDVQVRIRQARGFLDHGDKVLVSCIFKGREMAHREFGDRLIQRFKAEFALEAKIEKEPSMEGTRLTMLLTPLAQDVKKKLQKEAEAKRLQAEGKDESAHHRRVITREEAERERLAKEGAAAAPESAGAEPAKSKN